MFDYENFHDAIETMHVGWCWKDAFVSRIEWAIKLHYDYRDKYNRYCMAEQLEAMYRGLA